MGRKSNCKQNSKKSGGKDNNKFVLQKRKELAFLVDKLLKLTSIFQASQNPSKSWKHHLEIENILKEVRNVEAPLGSKSKPIPRHASMTAYLKWLDENGAQYNGVEIKEFEGYDLGLQAKKHFPEGSLILTVPNKVMMTEKDAKNSQLASFIAVDPLLQNMPNITLALFLLLEKNNPDSFWKPYIDVLPDKYSTVLFFTSEELSEIRPSPVFESSLKLYRSIARQYAYFYNKIHTLELPVLKLLQDVFTYENYRWAVSTVMTRQNNIQLGEDNVTAFIPLWDMCNHEHGKITTDYNKELNRGECYALRDFAPEEQIFIFYGARPNSGLFLHNGFVYPQNKHDSLALALGVSANDPLRESKSSLLSSLGLASVTHYYLYRGDSPLSAELRAFVRIFNMNQEELTKWLSKSIPSDLVLSDPESAAAVGHDIDRRAYTFLLTRCGLIKASYKKLEADGSENLHRKNIRLLKECEIQILDGAINYLENILKSLPTAEVEK